MIESFRSIIKSTLYGKHAHIDPLRVLDCTTPEIARKKPSKTMRSVWDLLYHMVYWQDVVLAAFEGDETVKDANDAASWPQDDELRSDDDWLDLVEQFKRGLERLEQLTETEDLMIEPTAWPNSTLFQNLLVEITHNSYHLGQIVAVLQALDAWS